MKKTDVDRNYYDFFLHDKEADKFVQRVSEVLSVDEW